MSGVVRESASDDHPEDMRSLVPCRSEFRSIDSEYNMTSISPYNV